jgi:hypothetical protein
VHRAPHLVDDADVLVAERLPRKIRADETVEQMEVRAADAARRDFEDDVGGVLDLGLRFVLDR